MGGPSDADLMKESMAALLSDEVDLENKIVAFDNFEQLVENIDNANNMEPLGLWTPLVGLLQHKEADMRRMAAWCIGTAVQNNEKGQDKVGSRSFLNTSHAMVANFLLLVTRSQCPPYFGVTRHNRFGLESSPKIRLCTFICRSQLPTKYG